MKTVWINKVRKREVKSGYKILSLEILYIDALNFAFDHPRREFVRSFF